MGYRLRQRQPFRFAPLTTSEIKENKGCGGGFDAGDSSGTRGVMRETSGLERKLGHELGPRPFLDRDYKSLSRDGASLSRGKLRNMKIPQRNALHSWNPEGIN